MKKELFKPHKLAALRAYKGLDQEALAKQTGLSRPTIQRLETGRAKRPNLDTLQALAEFFQVPVSVFLSDEAIHLT